MMKLRVISTFAGAEGFGLGFEQAGMEVVAQVENDEQKLFILNKHYPDIPKIRDIRDAGRHNLPAADVICGGFPCQDVSTAGKRAGLAGERSGLWFEFHRILAELKPTWVVIENVPGLLSSCGCPTCNALRRLLRIHRYLRRKRKITQPCAFCNAAQRLLKSHQGRDFALILRGLVELGYGVCWRILDAQYFGVAQRRKRVFIVGHLGDGRAAEVLFERDGSPWDSPPRRTAGQGVAAPVKASAPSRRNGGSSPSADDFVLATGAPAGDALEAAHSFRMRGFGDYEADSAASTLKSRDGKDSTDLIVFNWNRAATAGLGESDILSPTLRAGDNGSNMPAVAIDTRHDRVTDISGTLQANSSGGYSLNYINPVMTFDPQVITSPQNQSRVEAGEPANSLTGNRMGLVQGHTVRRLTPLECERLQGFPDQWTAGLSDSARYRAMGDAVCVPVLRWIGQRIVEVQRCIS